MLQNQELASAFGARMRDGMTPISKGFLLAVAIGLAVSGCSSASLMGEQQPATVPAGTRFQAGDWFNVTVYGEPSLSGDFQIDPSGTVLLPLAGPTKAAGMTSTELAEALTKRYRSEYVRDPKVTVIGPRPRG
jgi:protein involved in polysaccharide export with SLBB domain